MTGEDRREPLRLASYNIHFGIGQDGAYDLARIAERVAAADIICLQEVVQGWPALRHVDQAKELAERLRRHHVFGASLDVHADQLSDDGRIQHRRQTFGNMVMSRWPIRATRTLLLPKRTEPETFDLQRSVTEAVIDWPGGPLRVYCVHLSHVSPRQRAPQIDALLQWVAEAPAVGRPWDHEHPTLQALGVEPIELPAGAILMGDFNASPRDEGYGRLLAGGLRDAWLEAGGDPAAGQTFMKAPHAGFRIDHCFLTGGFPGQAKRAWIDETAIGSDHYPLFVELEVD